MTDCQTNEELRELMNEDAMLDILQTVGYRGVPSTDTIDSVPDITR